MNIDPARRNSAVSLGLGMCLAIDAGLLAILGVTGSLAFGAAWVLLKAGGVI
jgi:hypothetical protein